LSRQQPTSCESWRSSSLMAGVWCLWRTYYVSAGSPRCLFRLLLCIYSAMDSRRSCRRQDEPRRKDDAPHLPYTLSVCQRDCSILLLHFLEHPADGLTPFAWPTYCLLLSQKSNVIAHKRTILAIRSVRTPDVIARSALELQHRIQERPTVGPLIIPISTTGPCIASR
jgi:hypothetical protein